MKLAHSPAAAELEYDEQAALIDALHCLRVAVTVFDAHERLTFANQHFNYLFRSMPPRDALLGQSYEQLIRLEIAGGEIAAADARSAEAFIARRRAQLRDGEYRPLDIHLADGRIVEIKARRTRTGGWIALWSDVTAARHAQTRLEDAVALSAEAFAFFDKNDRLAVCNDGYAEFFGQKTANDIVGRQFADLMNGAKTSPRIAHKENPEEWLARRMEVHTAPAGAMTIELTSGAAYLMRDRATAEGGRVVVFTDVTDHRRVELAYQEQAKTLAEARDKAAAQADYLADLTRRFDEAAASADSTKTTLMRTMSHELKTPLNAIIGFSDLMLSMADRFDAEQVKEYAGLIHAGGQNLLRLINQILDLTKLSAGRYELHREQIDVAAALWAVAGTFEARAAAKNLKIDLDAPACLVATADENALTTMLTALVDNAVRFTQDSGHISLSLARDGAMISARVRDNGPGVSVDDAARILRPFEQGGCGTSDHAAGAGLGLTLTKAFAEAHGGTLSIESAPGQGFTAIVTLPSA